MKNNLRMIMAEQHMNIEDLSKATGLNRNTVAYLYNEKKQCNIYTLMLMCDALSVTPNEILITKMA